MLIYTSWEYVWSYLACPSHRIPGDVEENVVSKDLNIVELSRLLMAKNAKPSQ